eukprot:TRINITY_DN11195_c0_g1_i2.p1 TRINITY_DN11195_c0_g1~~TRINITY_DN11195_c0_g1_i2.p1  ORF type:complete len:269 (-),score=59.54 TRINITY_DN11195_c0_g1_i2:220-1026(-)
MKRKQDQERSAGMTQEVRPFGGRRKTYLLKPNALAEAGLPPPALAFKRRNTIEVHSLDSTQEIRIRTPPAKARGSLSSGEQHMDDVDLLLRRGSLASSEEGGVMGRMVTTGADCSEELCEKCGQPLVRPLPEKSEVSPTADGGFAARRCSLEIAAQIAPPALPLSQAKEALEAVADGVWISEGSMASIEGSSVAAVTQRRGWGRAACWGCSALDCLDLLDIHPFRKLLKEPEDPSKAPLLPQEKPQPFLARKTPLTPPLVHSSNTLLT